MKVGDTVASKTTGKKYKVVEMPIGRRGFRCIEVEPQKYYFFDEEVKAVEEQNTNEQVLKWIPFVSRYDEEEQQDMLQGETPENEQEILVTDGKSVWADTFMNECECYLDSGCDLVSTVIAWMPLPEPYKS